MGEFFNRLRLSAGHTDVILAIGMIGLIVLLIIPLPPFLLDVLLCFSIVFSIMSLLLTIYVENALDFSSFPSLLLFLTLYRLGLNIASTRLILTRGEGGDIIRTFGEFVTHGNLIVGMLLFTLLTVINFVVVTKGAGRIAEVAARFTLEALPGKQLAIDGELSSGHISQVEAKEARNRISQEADFYGAMDGASKFVRGDAVASLIITIVNIIGGFSIALTMKEFSWESCLTTYTRLTIGDGLVSQIPALLVSIAAGILVTRASSGSLSKSITKQVFHQPKVLLIAGITLLVMGLVPGMPILVMLPIGLAFLGIAYFQFKGNEAIEQEAKKTERISLFAYPLEIELGFQVVILADPLLQKLKDIRKQIASKVGIYVPKVQISDNSDLSPTSWRIRVKGIITFSGRDADLQLLSSKLTETIESHASELITRQDVVQMIQEAKQFDSAVVEELIGKKLSIGQLLKVLQNLLKEGIPIRDFVTILEILADHAKGEQSDIGEITEYVRQGLSRGISEKFFGKKQIGHVITLDPKVEQILDASKGKLRPLTVKKMSECLLHFTEEASKNGIKPILLTESSVRFRLKGLIESQFPELPVLSYKEVTSDVKLKTIGMVSNEVLI